MVASRWKDIWLKRLQQAGEPWVNTWASHQTRDEFWKHASICEDYSKVMETRTLEAGASLFFQNG